MIRFRFWRCRQKSQSRSVVNWPPFVDRLFAAVGAVVESDVAAFYSAWEFDLPTGDAEDLFDELKAAYEDILLIDSPEKADAAAQRFMDTMGDGTQNGS